MWTVRRSVQRVFRSIGKASVKATGNEFFQNLVLRRHRTDDRDITFNERDELDIRFKQDFLVQPELLDESDPDPDDEGADDEEWVDPKMVKVPILFEEQRQEMYALHVSNPERWTLEAISQKFGSSLDRTRAVILLMQLRYDLMKEKGFAVTVHPPKKPIDDLQSFNIQVLNDYYLYKCQEPYFSDYIEKSSPERSLKLKYLREAMRRQEADALKDDDSNREDSEFDDEEYDDDEDEDDEEEGSENSKSLSEGAESVDGESHSLQEHSVAGDSELQEVSEDIQSEEEIDLDYQGEEEEEEEESTEYSELSSSALKGRTIPGQRELTPEDKEAFHKWRKSIEDVFEKEDGKLEEEVVFEENDDEDSDSSDSEYAGSEESSDRSLEEEEDNVKELIYDTDDDKNLLYKAYENHSEGGNEEGENEDDEDNESGSFNYEELLKEHSTLSQLNRLRLMELNDKQAYEDSQKLVHAVKEKLKDRMKKPLTRDIFGNSGDDFYQAYVDAIRQSKPRIEVKIPELWLELYQCYIKTSTKTPKDTLDEYNKRYILSKEVETKIEKDESGEERIIEIPTNIKYDESKLLNLSDDEIQSIISNLNDHFRRLKNVNTREKDREETYNDLVQNWGAKPGFSETPNHIPATKKNRRRRRLVSSYFPRLLHDQDARKEYNYLIQRITKETKASINYDHELYHDRYQREIEHERQWKDDEYKENYEKDQSTIPLVKPSKWKFAYRNLNENRKQNSLNLVGVPQKAVIITRTGKVRKPTPLEEIELSWNPHPEYTSKLFAEKFSYLRAKVVTPYKDHDKEDYLTKKILHDKTAEREKIREQRAAAKQAQK
eukprot:gene4319-4631_t